MPTWPSPVSTTGMDADTDGLPRSDILDLTTKFNDVIAMRGVAGGVCDLDGAGKVPSARLATALAAIYALTPAADRGLYFTSASAASLFTLTSFARTLLDDADAATARATLGVTPMNVSGTAPVSVANGTTAPVISMAAATAGAAGHMTAAYAAKLDGIAAGANVGITSDIGAVGVGMMAWLYYPSGGAGVASGGTIAGSGLVWPTDDATVVSVGTWRNISGMPAASGSGSHNTWQRIA